MMEEQVAQNTDNQSAPVAQETQQEKMLRQSEVNDIVGRVRQEANAKLEEYRRQVESKTQQSQQAHQSQSGMTEERYRQIAAEELQRQRDAWMTDAQQKADEQAAQRIVKNFYDKMEQGKSKYSDFETTTQNVELRKYPNVVHMLSEHIDNASDVFYELSKKRSEMSKLEVLAREFPEDAIYDLKRLSESIKKNEATGNFRETNAPLSQQRSSGGVGTDSGGALSMRDLKAKYRV